ncbi:MAG TPA: hypothetical protein DDZ51_16720 [Planctomycetaceae bacterium]|nr:hypothetical protein [Planctomycetaceae bacterium]
MRAKSDSDEDGGLDSLLDTMTNVVGILVLVLIITQMSVAEVVSRITAENRVAPEQVEELSEVLRKKQEEQDELQRIMVDPLNVDAERQLEELEKKKELLERRKQLLAAKNKERNEYAMKLDQDRQTAKKNTTEIEETKVKRDELTQLITTMATQKAELEARLEKTPNVKAPPAVEITVPDPRPAPSGTKPLLFVCSANSLYPLDVEFFRGRAELRAKEIIARLGLDRDPKAGINPELFTKPFERLKDQNDYFEAEYFVLNELSPRIRLKPRSGRGISEREVGSARSRFRSQGVASINPQQFYARFFVLPDSHEVYVTARAAFTDAGILSGWDPQPEAWTYETTVPGGITLGPPKPPAPTPPPPTTPPKPANVID